MSYLIEFVPGDGQFIVEGWILPVNAIASGVRLCDPMQCLFESIFQLFRLRPGVNIRGCEVLGTTQPVRLG